jgi:hypothetical protein
MNSKVQMGINEIPAAIVVGRRMMSANLDFLFYR